MPSVLNFFSVLLIFGILEPILSENTQLCEELPKVLDSNASCCEPPQFDDDKIIEDCMKQFNSTNYTEGERYCKVSDCIFKNCNFLKPDGSVDKVVMNKYFEEHLRKNHNDWVNLFKTAAIEPCARMIEEDFEQIQTFLEVNKVDILPSSSQCAVKHTLMFFCMDLNLVANCPSKYATGGAECQDGRNFLKKCVNSTERFLQFINIKARFIE
ncbi:general odorant-binding protein 66-like [Uranotaenia lowii]|uniref:general odorant-binding protein 66-like n=1 Tax=Uranotaenia lowii TaxID=190385 RepID=UPI00247B13AB|nr:general odorant-binding protein 66-like [Uranotaenia lowii]